MDGKTGRIAVTDTRRLQQLKYTQIDETKLTLIASCRDTLLPHVDEIVDRLYDGIYQESHLRAIIDQHSTLDRLKVTQKRYLLEVFAGKIDDRYIENRYMVGRAHARIGLGLEWYVATYMKYLEILSRIVQRHVPEHQMELMNALNAVFNFDIQVILESYNRAEVDRAAHPIRYELDKIRYLIGLTDEDLQILDRFSGLISFRAADIVKRFCGLLFQRVDQNVPLLIRVPLDRDDFYERMLESFSQFFQDKIYLEQELYYRTIRDWSRLVLDELIDEDFFFVAGDCLCEAMRDVFLASPNGIDLELQRFLRSFERLVRFTVSMTNETLKPYLLLRKLQIFGICTYEISTIDFGRITWVDEHMRKGIQQGKFGIQNPDNPIGQRCYQVIRQRAFPCTDCPVLNKSAEPVTFVCGEAGNEQYYKVRQIPQNEIFELSRALLVVQDTTHESKILFNMIDRLLQLAEYRDKDTGNHVYRIGVLAGELARLAGCEDSFVSQIRVAAQFHDIGKVGIPDQILNKPGTLTAEERVAIQTHAEIGHQILANLDLPVIQMAARIARTHHEWWNGDGYPFGLAGEDIPLEGRIVAIVDVFDALLSKRPYKPALPPDEVKEILHRGRGKQFDPQLIDLFLQMWDELVELRARISREED